MSGRGSAKDLPPPPPLPLPLPTRRSTRSSSRAASASTCTNGTGSGVAGGSGGTSDGGGGRTAPAPAAAGSSTTRPTRSNRRSSSNSTAAARLQEARSARSESDLVAAMAEARRREAQAHARMAELAGAAPGGNAGGGDDDDDDQARAAEAAAAQFFAAHDPYDASTDEEEDEEMDDPEEDYGHMDHHDADDDDEEDSDEANIVARAMADARREAEAATTRAARVALTRRQREANAEAAVAGRTRPTRRGGTAGGGGASSGTAGVTAVSGASDRGTAAPAAAASRAPPPTRRPGESLAYRRTLARAGARSAAARTAAGAVGAGGPNGTSRALAAQQNSVSAVDAANLGPPTGLRNDDGVPTYYPPLPGSSGGGNGAGPSILATVPAGAGGLEGDIVGDLRRAIAGGREGIHGAVLPPPVAGFAGYPGALGGGGRDRYRNQNAAGGGAGAAADDVDPTALLVACARRFGNNFYPDPLMPYCGRRMGRNVVPSRDGTCSPRISSRGRTTTCPSCARLHDSLRLARLRHMFGGAEDIVVLPPGGGSVKKTANATADTAGTATAEAEASQPTIGDAALIAALRSNSGQFCPTVSLLSRQLGLQPRPHPREVAYIARVLGLPEKLARIALRRKNCDASLTMGWICGFAGAGNQRVQVARKSPMEICYEEALDEEQRQIKKSAVNGGSANNDVAEEPLAILCSLCTEFDVSAASPAAAFGTSTSLSKTASGKGKGRLKSTGDDDKMDIDEDVEGSSNGSGDEPILLDGHCLLPAKRYGSLNNNRNELEKPLTTEEERALQEALDAKIHVDEIDTVVMKGLGNIITESKEKDVGKEVGDSVAFDVKKFSVATQRKLYHYIMENANPKCPMCTLSIPSVHSGRRQCIQCQMCEGCIRFIRQKKFTTFAVEEPVARKSLKAGTQAAKKLVARKPCTKEGAKASPATAIAIATATAKHDQEPYNSEEDEDYDPALDSTVEDGDMELDAADDFIDEKDVLAEDDKSIVHKCPAQPNGSHLHHHPLYLQFTRSKTAHCDIEGRCCTAMTRSMRWYVSWSCSVCDFDVCHVCIGTDAPDQAPTSRSIPNSRSIALPSGGAKAADGMFDRRLGLFVSSKDSAKEASTKKRPGGLAAATAAFSAAKRKASAAKTAAAAQSSSSSTARTARPTSAATSKASKAPPRRSASAPTSSGTAPRLAPASSRTASAPAPAPRARPALAGTAAAASRRTDADATAAALAAIPDIEVFDPARHLHGVHGVLDDGDALDDPMEYFDRIFERLGAGARGGAALAAGRAARIRDLQNLRIEVPAGMAARGGIGLAIATIGGGRARVRVGRAGDAGARNRRAIEKSLKKKDEKLVTQIWNVEPPPPGKDSGIVVVNTGNVTPNTATDLGSGLLAPPSMTDYGRIWLYALRGGGNAGHAGTNSGGGDASRNSSLVVMTEDAKAALSTFMKYAGKSTATSPPALDITTAELYCQRIQSVVPNRAASIKTKAYGMISMGKLGLVGTILSAASFAPLALSKMTSSTDGALPALEMPPSSLTAATSNARPPPRLTRKRKREDEASAEAAKKKANKASPSHEAAQATISICFCGSPIDLKTAPDGCVGCLRCGHAVHAPCAADLLLGGGVCPACREPLYLPRLASGEIEAAENIFQKELLDMDKPEEPSNNNNSGDEEEKKCPSVADDKSGSETENAPISIKDGDIVRVSPDAELCSTVQSSCPTSGGWYPDMAECCGIEGQIIATVSLGAIATKSEAYRIRMKVPVPDTNANSNANAKKKSKGRGHSFRYTRRSRSLQAGRGNRDGHASISTACIECNRVSDDMRMCVNCETCITCLSRSTDKADRCQTNVHQWIWSPALIKFVRKDILPRVYTESNSRNAQSNKKDVEAATEEAQKHMLRLRSELHAVKASRDRVRAEAETIFGTSVNDDDGGAAAKMMVGLVRDRAELKLPESIEALRRAMTAKGSAFEFHLAIHLLSLAEQWASNPTFGPSVPPPASVMTEVKTIQKFVSDRNLEAAARHIRSYNTNDEVEESKWECAFDATGTYIAKAGAQICLLAYPKDNAPRTGFVIEPKARFQASFEHIDNNGKAWAQVVEPTDWPDSYLASLDDASGEGYSAVLVGSRVKRGPNWRYGNQDGGEGNEGVIVKARKGLVLVKWKGIESKFRYRYQPKKAGQDESSSSSKKEVEICSAIAPPQGWFQINTFPPTVDRICNTLQCWACSKDLCASSTNKAVYKRVDTSRLKKGDKVLVASTLTPVVVEEVTEHRVHCSFAMPTEDSSPENGDEKPPAKRTRRKKAEPKDEPKNAASMAIAAAASSARVWYRPVDLVRPCDERKAAVPSEYTSEVRMVAGKLRTMHEVALLHPGDKDGAKKAWTEAGEANDDPHGDLSSYASCIRGHLLHPKCFQTALLSGQRCPAPGCGELLWLPSVVKDETHVTCGDGGTSASSSDTESMRAETDLSTHGEEAKAGEGGSDANELFTEEELASEGCRMCPACCSGPFLNQHCSDMRTHHGQCSAMAWRSSRDGRRRTPCMPNGMTYQVSATEISKRLMQLSKGKSVADVLPRCPTHKVSVMFNGCRGCGHLFTDLGWHNLPKWDPNAKEKVALDKKKMQASVLLCSQIRKEAAQLEFEREALKGLHKLNADMVD